MFFKSGGWRLLLGISLGCISSFKFYNCWEKLFGWLKHVMISRVLGKNKSIIIVVVFLTLFKWYKLFCNWCFLCVTNCWFKELCRIFLPNKKKNQDRTVCFSLWFIKRWYRFAGPYLIFDSGHPCHTKLNIAFNMARRISESIWTRKTLYKLPQALEYLLRL